MDIRIEKGRNDVKNEYTEVKTPIINFEKVDNRGIIFEKICDNVNIVLNMKKLTMERW